MTTRPHPLGGSFSSSRLLMLLPCRVTFSLFFFNDTATTEIYTLSLHDALPIYPADYDDDERFDDDRHPHLGVDRSEEHTSELQSRLHLVCRLLLEKKKLHPTPQFLCSTTLIATRCSSSLSHSRQADIAPNLPHS